MTIDNIDASDYLRFMENERWNIKFRRALANRLFQYLSLHRSDVKLDDLRVPTVVSLTEMDGVSGFVLKEVSGGDRFQETFVEHFLPADFAFGVTSDEDAKNDFIHYLHLKSQT